MKSTVSYRSEIRGVIEIALAYQMSYLGKVAKKARASVRLGLLALLMVLPSSLKVPLYRSLFGYSIGRGVKIGFSWIDVGELEIGDGVSIGHLNRFKRVPHVSIGAHTIIANANTFTSAPEFTSKQSLRTRKNLPRLVIGEQCGISLGHYFDVQDEIVVGRFTTIAGVGSAFWTHYLDLSSATQATKAIRIGEYCMVGAGAKFVPGSAVGDRCVVALGSVITRQYSESLWMFAGNPAKPIKPLPPNAKYFHRVAGWIGTPELDQTQ